ncbi:MAG: hypothetical protein ACR2LV_10345 [Solirubrobacteraceae bacterium]
MPSPPPERPSTQRASPARLYQGVPESGPAGFAGQLVAFAQELREERVAVGTSEMLDAFAALEQVSWTGETDFKAALSATLAKSPEDRRVFELVFERFFFRAAEAAASRHRIGEGARGQAAHEIDLDELRRQIAAALRDGSGVAMGDLARLAIAAFGRGEGSGVLGVDVQRIRRELGLRAQRQPELPETDPHHNGVPAEQMSRF